MPEKSQRHLAAILFADIAGYTALMQRDEQAALEKLAQFKQTLEVKTAEFQGSIIQYYGDGCLIVFDSPLDAVACAKSMQETFRDEVPVRIGIHLGDVVFKEGNAFGDSVNIASRIESLGVPEAVLLSQTVRNQIKNHPEFQFVSLGSFDFKNVDEPMEVFVLANEGFPVPKREEMQGKLKTQTEDTNGSFFQRIWHKKIPQILTAYVLIAWLCLQLFDRALNQFGISPYWAQIFFISVIGIVPSLLVYLNNRERIHQRHLQLSEKIFFPFNLVALGAVLFFMFRTADLGATTKNITFTNADGIEETQNIVKAAFRKRFPIFTFSPMREDSANAWIGFAVANYVSYKLGQNKYLSPAEISGKFTKVEKIQRSEPYKEPFYIDGRYQVMGGRYEFIPALRDKKTGTLIQERRFSGTDLLSLMDSVGRYLIQATGLTPSQIGESPELSIQEVVSDNLEALKHYVIADKGLGNFTQNIEKAIELDSTFAIAALIYANNLFFYEKGQLEAKLAIDRAMRHRKRLPVRDQIDVRATKFLIDNEWEKAEKLLQIQLEIDPDNEIFNNALTNIYFKTSQLDKLVTHTENWFSRNPNVSTRLATMEALLLNGETAKVIRLAKSYLLTDPQNTDVLSSLADAYILDEDYDRAKETFEKIILINPETEININKSLEAVEYMKNHPVSQMNLSKYEGLYRFESGEMMVELKKINKHLCSKATNQHAIFMFPAGEYTLKRGTPEKGWVREYFCNEKGEIISDKSTQNYSSKSYVNYRWKQDSTIWNAENFLRKKDYEEAQIAYRKAIEKHPEHFYLYQALQHLNYLKSKTGDEVQRKFQEIAGQYGDINVWIENGLLFYKKPGDARRVLLPISENRFTTLLSYSFNYEFIERQGKITGFQRYQYNHETKEWEKLEDWYYEKTKSPD